ncbi:TlpA disulfide reductase family protein [Mucilaginibacter sp. CAU 1740]|uniref:TlpA family protein disulfide reductase n=1 Tax=Mucilaginibacter sp. CAU 1740 TaxID=3140365 RepID=UPI00325A5286
MKTLSQTLLALGLIVFSISAQAQNVSSKKVSTGNKIKDGHKSVVSKINSNNDSAVIVKPQAIPTKGFRVYGTIKGVDKGVIHTITHNNTPGDSALIVDGKFIITGNMDEPDRKGFIITPGNWSFSLLMEDTTITATIDTADALHQRGGGVDYPMIWHVDQTGSDFGDTYTRYFNETGQSAAISLMKQLKFANAADRASIMSKMDSLRGSMTEKQKTWIENYIQKDPTSVAGVFIFNEFYHTMLSANPPKGYLLSMVGKFRGKATAYKDYKSLSDEAGNLKNRDANTVVPDFTLPQRNNAKFKLSSKRGKIVLIDFWASWCVPC